MNADVMFLILGLASLVAPVALLIPIGISMLVRRPISERVTARWTQFTVIVGLVATVAILVLMLVTGNRSVVIEVGNLASIPEEHYHFHMQFLFDRLSVPFAILSFTLVGTIGAFASRYLHRESGFQRFFLLYAVFLLGTVVASLAGSIETLFLGWELVGLASALLVAYFHERTAPVFNGQRVWSVYRLADASFLIAAVTLHHLTGTGDFSQLMGQGDWPAGTATLSTNHALFVGLLLLVAAAGKSALIPFSGWLPRAMEGPTPSSAVFYGALSVHLGTYLLLRVSPLLDLSLVLGAAVVILGLASAIFGAMASRVQSDIKSALAFASLTQVGLITAEIGLGLRYLALVHIIGHACLRTLQLVRAPSLLHDYHRLENAIGTHLPANKAIAARCISNHMWLKLYRFALERGHLDSIVDEYIVQPFVSLFRWFDVVERKWIGLLSGRKSESQVPSSANVAKGKESS